MTDQQETDKSRSARALIILENMYQFVGLLDIAGNLVEANRSALEAAGIAYLDVIGKPFWETPWWSHDFAVREKLKDAIARAARGEMVRFEAEHFADQSDRETIIVDFSIKPVRDAQGQIVYLLPEGRDITEKKRAERKADTMFHALSELLPGKVLDTKYQIKQKVGTGAYGVVYQATHVGLGRDVAVKVFHPSFGNYTLDDLDRFRLEGMSACQVNHPNAVEILDAGVSTEGIAYLVMELLAGISLKAELNRQKRLSVERCLEIGVPICSVLAEAHRNGIVHRDIKPDNIFLHQATAGLVVKLIDFGIAKLMDESALKGARDLTTKGMVIGTPPYMAPERASNRSYDGRSDVYSLGITLYEMLTGRLPFDPDEYGFVEVLLMHATAPPPPLRELNDQIPEAVEAAVLRALAKDPDERPGAAELGADLSRLLNEHRDYLRAR